MVGEPVEPKPVSSSFERCRAGDGVKYYISISPPKKNRTAYLGLTHRIMVRTFIVLMLFYDA